MRNYIIRFEGVPVGSLGSASTHERTVSGGCDASAILALYATHEHIRNPREVMDPQDESGTLRPMGFGDHAEGCGCADATRFGIEVRVETKDGPQWQRVRPTGGKPYEYDTRREAEDMRRLCYDADPTQARVVEVKP